MCSTRAANGSMSSQAKGSKLPFSAAPLRKTSALCPLIHRAGLRGDVAALLLSFCSSPGFMSLNRAPDYQLRFPPRLEGFFKFS